VVLRYLLADIPQLLGQARRLIDSDEQLGLTAVALAEVAWTLSGPRYRRPRAEVGIQLALFLGRANIAAIGFDKRRAEAALLACGATRGAPDIGDALIAACCQSEGLEEIYTFDQRFARTGLVTVVPS